MHFNGRLRTAAKLAYHVEYGGYYPAMLKSGKELNGMALTQDEKNKVQCIVEWMFNQVKQKDRCF